MRRAWWFVAWPAAGMMVALAACGQLLATDPSLPGADDAAAEDARDPGLDANGPDAKVVGDASDAATVLISDSFEGPPALSCGDGWALEEGSSSQSALARTGSISCMICANASGPGALGANFLPVGPGAYELTGFARVATDEGPNRMMRVEVRLAGDTLDVGNGDLNLTPSWQMFQATAITDGGLNQGTVRLHIPGADAGCMYVDDVTLVHHRL